MPLLMAAAFDDDLIEKVAEVIGTEARAWGNAGYSGVDYWTPDVNPFRDPRWGRGAETPGEDALRIKGYTTAIIHGLEGNLTERRIVATCKHYAGNDLESWHGVTRHDFDAKISMQDLAEYYLQPFQQCARENVGSFMCSYNAVNGVPACASTYLLQTVLRDHWNWTQDNNYVTSDCEALLDISANHHYAPTNAAGTALAFNAGTDSSCEYESSSDIPGAWSSGALNETTVDRALRRLYEGLVRTGYFDGPSAHYASLGWADVNTPAAQKLALQAAIDGMVMLKNDKSALPLNIKADSKLAMIGYWAADEKKIQGGYSGTAPYLRSPVWAAKQMGLTVTNATGPILQSNSAPDNWTTAALAAADKSDYILYFGGQDTSVAAEGTDRTSLDWPEAQLTLIAKLSSLGKPLIIFQMGDQLDNTPLLTNKNVHSVVWTHWLGQEGGNAIMQIVTGAKSPAGRLPVTQYPSNYTQLAMTDMNLRPDGAANPGRTYRWYPTPVQAFGFGMHYTTFDADFGSYTEEISIPSFLAKCSDPLKDRCPLPSLPVSVANTGSHTSDYVVLAFVKSEAGPKPYPIKTLAAYKRLRDIAPGKKVESKLTWDLASLARHNKKGDTVLYPGTYTIMIDEPTQKTMTLKLTGCAAVLDRWPQPN